MGLFSFNPASIITSLKDDAEKRAAIALALNLTWSAYITFLYEVSLAITGKPILGWFAPGLKRMAASALLLLQNESNFKMIQLAVPKGLIDDKELLDSVWWEKISESRGK